MSDESPLPNISVAAVTGVPDSLDQGQSAVVTASVVTNNPFGDITFSVFNPLGYDDVFNIGPPQLTYGDSYLLNDVAKWTPKLLRSYSGQGIGRVSV